MTKRVKVVVSPVELRQRFFKLTYINVFEVRKFAKRMLRLYFLNPDCMSEDEADALFQFVSETNKYYRYANKKSKSSISRP